MPLHSPLHLPTVIVRSVRRAWHDRRTAPLVFGPSGRRPVTGPITGPITEVIDDPDGPMRLIRVRGAVTPDTIQTVFDAWADLFAPSMVHLDLRDAQIVGRATMLRLEQALDHLERQQIGVRLVGIDPSHPALSR